MKILRIVLIVFAVVAVVWSAMLITDITRSNDFQKPVFAKEIRVEADNDIIIYQGLGYTVKREFFENQNDEPICVSSEVYLFGKIMISAVIT